MDVQQFNGKRALVTGVGRGIGREIARSLVRCGAKTYGLTKSQSSVVSLNQEDPDIEVYQVDMADWNETRRVVESLLPLDFLINNAGIGILKSFVEWTETEIDETFNINYKAVFNISQVVANDWLMNKKSGSIVNVSSNSSMRTHAGLSGYSSSKAAVDSLTKYMALELGPSNIRVNAVNPTVIPTDMSMVILKDPDLAKSRISKIPIGRFGEKSEVAAVVLFLLSDCASLVTGVTLPVDGGDIL